MPFHCKGVCNRLQSVSRRYSDNSVRCFTCDVFIKLKGTYITNNNQTRCLCCHNRIRSKRRLFGKVKAFVTNTV